MTLLGKLVRATHEITFVGIVRAEVRKRGALVALRVQRPGVLAATPNAKCRGAVVTVPIERVDGVVNRRKSWPHQVEPIR